MKGEKVFNTKNYNLFVLLEFALSAVIILSTLLIRPGITSKAFALSFITLFVAVFRCCFKRKTKLFGLMLIITVGALFCVCCSTLIMGGTLSYEYLKEYIIFISTILLMYYAVNTKINANTTLFLLKFNVIISFLYPVAYRFFPLHDKFNDLALNFSNPNLAGMWILLSILYCALAFFALKKVLWKIISIVSVALNVFLILQTKARNCFISLFLFLILLAWLNIKKSNRLSKAVVLIVNILPIVFVPLYLQLIDPIIKKGWFSFLVSSGKNLTSRVTIWNRVLNELDVYWFTGAYPKTAGNAHNSHLVVLASYGIIILIAVIAFTTLVSNTLNNKLTCKQQAYALVAFFATLFLGFGEGALFSGGQGIYIMICGFILLANGNYPQDILKTTTQ